MTISVMQPNQEATASAPAAAADAPTLGLERLLRPRSIAVIGASRTPGTIGHQLVANLIRHGFTGAVYPVNPRANAICSVRAYPDISAVPDAVDLAVIAVPKESVVTVAQQCARRNVAGLVVISAGFAEAGPEGTAREQELRQVVRASHMRLVGPNCLGILNTDPSVSMNATFAPHMPPPGRVAFVSQSGALGLSVLDYARTLGVGIAQFVSIGNRADVSSNDLLLHWEDDASVGLILMYVESFGNSRHFLEIASRVTRKKPVVVMKSGRSSAGARAARSHTGGLAGSDRAADALLHQAGAIRAGSVEELFDIVAALSVLPLPRSRRTAVVTNSGGPGILAADALDERGLELAGLSPVTIRALRSVLPAEATVGNPVDLIVSAGPETYRAALDAVLTDGAVDSVIAVFVPAIAGPDSGIAEEIADAGARRRDKPLLAVLMGREGLSQASATVQRAGIPVYQFPESAARGLAALVQQRERSEQPVEQPRLLETDRAVADATLRRASGRQMLLGAAALEVLQAYGIPTAPARLARDSTTAVEIAATVGYPVALKVVSPNVVHKSDIGGVLTHLARPEDVRWAFAELTGRARKVAPEAAIDGILVQRMAGSGRELIVGVVRDPDHGPLIMFGLGGVLTEVIGDVVFRLAPLLPSDAAEMVRGLRGGKLLGAFRGALAVNLEALEEVLLRVSQLAMDFPEIQELDLNPVVASELGALVVDARIVVGG